MKKQHEDHEDHQDNEDNDVRQSCPAIIQEDVTQSINEPQVRAVKSQQFKPSSDATFDKMNEHEKHQYKNETERKFGLPERTYSEHKIEVNIINKKGTDFDCQKVQSLELSCQQESYRSGSLRSRSKKDQQQQQEEPRSAKKARRILQEQMRPKDFERREQIKQDIFNVLIAGAQDTGKTTFVRCFKKKQRKNDEPHIKSKTRQIRYELGRADENLANRRNNVYFIDLPGFQANQEDKYLRQIQQYAVIQWRNYQNKPDEDRRIHCCLYFLRGPRIKETDMYVLKRLSTMFNLIPVIAKSDQYTKEEVFQIKEEFHRKVASAGQVHLYDLEEFYRLKLGTDKINEFIHSKFGKFPPFAISSSFEKQSPESLGFVRKYPWGKVQIDNDEHTDFEKLSQLLSGDVRGQLLNKILPIPERQHSELVEQQIGVIGDQVVQQSVQKPSSLKNKIIVGSLIALSTYMLFKGHKQSSLFSRMMNKN